MGKAKRKLKKAGDWIDDKIIQPVVHTAENILKDPKALFAIALSIAVPGAGTLLGEYIGLSGTAATIAGNTIINTTLNGGDVKKGFVGAVLPHVGSATASFAAQKFVDLGVNQIVATTLGSVSGNVAMSYLAGTDPKTGAAMGLAQSLPMILSQSKTFSTLPKPVQSTLTAGLSASITKQDVTGAVVTAGLTSMDI